MVKKHTKVLKKDVLAPVVINYTKYTPFEGGIRITHVICVELGGSAP